MILALDDKKRRHYKTVATYVLNRYRSFSITSLQLLTSSAAVGTYNDYCSANNAYYKAGLVEVIEVLVLDAVLRPYILHQLELLLYKLGILIEGLLEVVSARKTRLEL